VSHGRAIDPIDITQFPTEQDVSDPGFEELFNQLVGDAGTPADGFEDDLAVANSLLDALDAALSEIGTQAANALELLAESIFRPPHPVGPPAGSTLDNVFAEILAVDPDLAGQDVLNLVDALPDVQTNVDTLGNDLAAAGLPTPPQPPGPLPAGCDAVLGFDITHSSPPIERDVQFLGGQNNPRRSIDSIILTQDIQNLFHLLYEAVGTNPDTQTIVLKITLEATAPDGLHGQITIKWNLQDGNERTTVLCLGVNVQDNFPSS